MPTRPQAVATIRIENERVKATEYAIVSGAETGWHRHGYDYVVVPLTDGRLLLEEPGGGEREVSLTAGIPYSRPVGVEHNVINAGSEPLRFLEIEMLK